MESATKRRITRLSAVVKPTVVKKRCEGTRGDMVRVGRDAGRAGTGCAAPAVPVPMGGTAALAVPMVGKPGRAGSRVSIGPGRLTSADGRGQNRGRLTRALTLIMALIRAGGSGRAGLRASIGPGRLTSA